MGVSRRNSGAGATVGDYSESPDIEHDNRRRPFEHIEEHSEWAHDSESNGLETRLTKVEWVAGSQKSISRTVRISSFLSSAASISAWSFSSASGTQKT
jgi:hypothetical protein